MSQHHVTDIRIAESACVNDVWFSKGNEGFNDAPHIQFEFQSVFGNWKNEADYVFITSRIHMSVRQAQELREAITLGLAGLEALEDDGYDSIQHEDIIAGLEVSA